jgi:hypothetical protein
MPRKGFAGAAVVTTITSNIASSGTGTFTIASATGWTFTATPFVVVVDRGLPAEEKILCSGIAGTTITMQTRGYDGTTQAAHNTPAQIIHIYDSVEADTANAHIFDTTRDDHSQYALTTVSRAQGSVTGGGTIAYSAAGNVSWSARMIIISNGNGADFSTAGFFDIGPSPTSGTITGVGSLGNVTPTGAGIPMSAWQTLYYILPIGSTSTFLPANLRMATYTGALQVPHTWIPIVTINGDGVPNYARWITGHITPLGVSLDSSEAFGTRAEALGWSLVNP